MRMPSLIAAILLGSWLRPCLAQQTPELPGLPTGLADEEFPEPGFRRVTPEEQEQRAREALAKGRYKTARRLFEAVLEQRPNDPRILFNLACTASRSGDLEDAAHYLEAAWAAGLRYPDLLDTDPDLEALRASPRGKALIERLLAEEAERARLQGVLQYFEASSLAGLRVVAPDPREEDRRYPLLVALHGHGGSPEPYAGMFESTEAPLDAIVAAPYGPYPVALERGHGYSWYPPLWLYRRATEGDMAEASEGDRADEVDRVSRRYVIAAIEALQRSHPVDPDRIFLLGHSEGGRLAYDLALERPDLFRGVILVAAPIPQRMATGDGIAAAAGRLKVLICHSRDDTSVDVDHAERAHRAFRDAGIESRLVLYPGGHGITVDLVHRIAKWIRKTAEEEPSE